MEKEDQNPKGKNHEGGAQAPKNPKNSTTAHKNATNSTQKAQKHHSGAFGFFTRVCQGVKNTPNLVKRAVTNIHKKPKNSPNPVQKAPQPAPKKPKPHSQGFNLIHDDDKDLMSQREIIAALNSFYNEGKTVTLEQRKELRFLKTVIKKGIPVSLRAHAYMIFSGAFHHLEGQRYVGRVSYAGILAKIKEEADPAKQEENDDLIDLITRDTYRTYFPQDFGIEEFSAAHGLELTTENRAEGRIKPEAEKLITDEIRALMEESGELRRKTTKILIAYAKTDGLVGYVQGMSSIAASVVYNVWLSGKERKRWRSGADGGARRGRKGQKRAKSGKKQKKSNSKKIDSDEKNQDRKGLKGDKKPDEDAGDAGWDDFDPFGLLDFELDFGEEDAFLIFYAIMQYSNQRKLYRDNLEVVQKDIEKFGLYFSHMEPELYKKMCGGDKVSVHTLPKPTPNTKFVKFCEFCPIFLIFSTFFKNFFRFLSEKISPPNQSPPSE